MTPIDSLTPEELREIAESLGYSRCIGGCQPKGEKEPRYWRTPSGREIRELPAFGSDANAALQLAHTLAEKGWRGECILETSGKVGFEFVRHANEYSDDAHLTKTGAQGEWEEHYFHSATGPHALPLALCRAYLSVIRAGKEQQG